MGTQTNPIKPFYFDPNQVHPTIVTNKGDGGDSCQSMGMYSIGAKDFDTFARFRTDKGWVRHPNQWNDPKDFSRDQITSVVCALALFSSTLLIDIRRKWEINSWREQNGDYVGPELRNAVRRGLGEKPKLLGEVQLFLSVLVRIFMARFDQDDVGDDKNLICLLYLSNQISQTRWSRSAMKLYRYRPWNFGQHLDWLRARVPSLLEKWTENPALSSKQAKHLIEVQKPAPECSPMEGTIRWYYREEAGGNEGFSVLFTWVFKFLKGKT